MLFGRNRNLIGLDIGDSSVKVVELNELSKGRGWQVTKLGWEPLSSEAIKSSSPLPSRSAIVQLEIASPPRG